MIFSDVRASFQLVRSTLIFDGVYRRNIGIWGSAVGGGSTSATSIFIKFNRQDLIERSLGKIIRRNPN